MSAGTDTVLDVLLIKNRATGACGARRHAGSGACVRRASTAASSPTTTCSMGFCTAHASQLARVRSRG